MHLAAKPNRNEQVSPVVQLQFAAVACAGCTVPAVAHPKGGNGNFQHGGRTKEAASASRYVDRLARLLHDATQSRYKWRPRTTASPTNDLISNGVLLQRTKSHAARFHPALPPGRLLVGDV
jgi:hypothetical protein